MTNIFAIRERVKNDLYEKEKKSNLIVWIPIYCCFMRCSCA
ncbi:hypothetical protein BFO_3217 [Tannerella forsythia 92A2]|uniref:Uncharacterized protein n=1 Tax=Tannerella forsythia (strain ATCC 43037 / JCM 10827 / CCUG 21028 A / KCTC 5666 / FDC 338) TaxID=203275 RepID=G8UI53_TANFA|nr:hypothetical protein BFO_3217 [Tannerella forsythia 92A2]